MSARIIAITKSTIVVNATKITTNDSIVSSEMMSAVMALLSIHRTAIIQNANITTRVASMKSGFVIFVCLNTAILTNKKDRIKSYSVTVVRQFNKKRLLFHGFKIT